MTERKSTRGKPIMDYKTLNATGFDSPVGNLFCEEVEEPAHTEKTEPATSGLALHFSQQTEKERLRFRLQSLTDEEELETLRRKIEEKEKSVASIRGKNKLEKQKEEGMFSVEQLRSQKDLNMRAKKELSKLGLSLSDHCESEDSESENEEVMSRRSKRTLKKSGIQAKASESVSNPQRYPHSHLRFEFVNNSIDFDKLELNMFVAGELEIISQSSTSFTESRSRLELLKRLMYLNRAFDFTVLKSLYAAILREIELGYRKWGDDFHYIENTVLATSSHVQKLKPKSDFSQESKVVKSDEKLWFCAKFQRNKCQNKDSHVLDIKGKMRFAKHICASCWQKDHKELPHPECSSVCPSNNS